VQRRTFSLPRVCIPGPGRRVGRGGGAVRADAPRRGLLTVRNHSSERRPLGERAVRPVLVAVECGHGKDASRRRRPTISNRSRQSRRTVPTQRSAFARAGAPAPSSSSPRFLPNLAHALTPHRLVG